MKIWKLQRSLFSNEDAPMILAYTENKQRQALIPLPEEMISDLFGEEVKIYVKASVKNGVLKIKKRVAEQEW